MGANGDGQLGIVAGVTKVAADLQALSDKFDTFRSDLLSQPNGLFPKQARTKNKVFSIVFCDFEYTLLDK